MIVIYKPDGSPLFGYTTDTGENVGSYTKSTDPVSGESIYTYTIGGSSVSSTNEPQPAGLLVDDDSFRLAELMGNDVLTLRFSLAESVNIPLRSWCMFEGHRYYIYMSPQITKQNNRNFNYVMPMYTSDYMLNITMFRNRTFSRTTGVYGGDKRLKFPLTATPREHLEMIAACLNEAETESNGVWAVDYGKTMGMVEDTDGANTNFDGRKYNDEGEKGLVSYELNYCIDAIRNDATAFNTEYEISDSIVTDEDTGSQTIFHLLSLRNIEYNKETPLLMEYGKGNGFVSGIMRKNEGEFPPIDRLYIQGGEQNIPSNYGLKRTTQIVGGEEVVSYDAESPNYLKSETLLLPKGAACFYSGGSFYFSKNPTVQIDSNGNRYVQQKNMFDTESGLPIYESLYDDNGNSLGTLQLMIPTACYLVSDDGRSLERVRHTYYDPYYSPRGTKVESFFDASEIYPMRVGGVSQVVTTVKTRSVDDGNGGTTTETYKLYDIIDALPDCPDYSQCSIPGETMTIIFQDGMLAGREFDLNTLEDGTVICTPVTVYDDGNNQISAKKLELCPSDQDGIVMPNETFSPAIGDHYIAFHCSLPEQYVSGISYGAEYRALREMARFMHDNGKETFTFTGTVQGKWAASVWDEIVEAYNDISHNFLQNTYGAYFSLGQHIKVADMQLFGNNGLVMRVTGIKQFVNAPHSPELTLSNAIVLKFNWVKHLAKTVEAVRVRPRFRRPDNPIFPRLGPFNEIIEFNEAVDIYGNPIELRRKLAVPFSTYKPFTQYVGTLDIAEQQDRVKINQALASLRSAETYLQQCRNAVLDIRNAIADSSNWEALKSVIYRDAHSGYVHGVTTIGDAGTESCSIIPSIGEAGSHASCSMATLDMDIPTDLPTE